MKKIFLLVLMICLSGGSLFASNIEDNSILDELNKEEIKNIDLDFNLKSFNSCEDMEDVMGEYIKTYWEKNKKRYAYPTMYRKDYMFLDAVSIDSDMVMEESVKSENVSGGDDGDYSKTNTQVKGVDESDIIKTDGKYIYYYNQTDKYVYIVKSGDLELIKKIKIPKTFSAPVLYIDENRLVIVSSGYSSVDYNKYNYWINRSAKTYTIVYDTTNIEKPVLTRLYISDGDFRKSRKIGDNIYIVSNNSFNIPYYNFKSVDDIDIDLNKMLPKKIDISKTSDTDKQNFNLKGKSFPYNVTTGNVANCNEIEYILPDDETIEKFDFNPSYNIVSVIDINDSEKEVETKIIAGSNSELYMSLESMYLTSSMYRPYNYSCARGMDCILPWFPRGTSTLVHKFDIDGQDIDYGNSTIVPGSPLNQYSMDEHDGNFRIITSTNAWSSEDNKSSTNLYLLDKDSLELEGKLEGIEPGEEFKSSRFIGDKLFLVTFERTDPLFVISLADKEKPEILGELKIPGYSTYLHPYDENHLIGLGYDTTENQWGGITTSGIKLDLYEINYDKECGDSNLTKEEKEKCDSGDYKGIIVKQKYSKTFGSRGSSSEALTNPRMFMWKQADNKLFLPATLYSNDGEDLYRNTDFFQGLVTMTIDKDSGIKEDYRITHMDDSKAVEARDKECSKYTPENTQKKCVKLIGGGEYCEAQKYNYVPKYCYADSTIGEYIASRSWNYRNDFIKRALWIGDKSFAISDGKITSHNSLGNQKNTVKFK